AATRSGRHGIQLLQGNWFSAERTDTSMRTRSLCLPRGPTATRDATYCKDLDWPSWTWRSRKNSHCRSTSAHNSASISLTCLITRTDRKSTRLNSSHVAISYAVFCLKKKRKSFRGVGGLQVGGVGAGGESDELRY